ncbi:hypothetical protein GW17_00038138 [Ensete ventricosum]|nr:hypothetical protein GW17_00038138 [Ensete ventricosum]
MKIWATADSKMQGYLGFKEFATAMKVFLLCYLLHQLIFRMMYDYLAKMNTSFWFLPPCGTSTSKERDHARFTCSC